MLLSHIPLDLDLLPSREGVHVVGGSARDILLGRTPVDYDIVVPQNPERFAAMTTERTHGRLVVLGPSGKRTYRVIVKGAILDITGMAGENIQEDLRRRDITINAMAIDLGDGRLVDVVGGEADLREKRIRMVSERNLAEDPLRLLRIFRFAALLPGFTVDPETLSAVRRCAAMIRLPAGERIRAELHGILAITPSFPVIFQMAETGLLSALFPSLSQGPPDLFAQTLAAYRELEEILRTPPPFLMEEPPFRPEQAPWLKCALLLRHVPLATNRPPLPEGMENDSVEAICRRLRLSRAEESLVLHIRRHHKCPRTLHEHIRAHGEDIREITRFFMLGQSRTPHLLLHALAEAYARNAAFHPRAEFLDFTERLLKRYHTEYLPRTRAPVWLTGNDLAASFGVSPSPAYKHILDALELARLSGEIEDREGALALADRLIRRGSTP